MKILTTSTRAKYQFRQTVNNYQNFRSGLFFSIVLIICPFLFYSYRLIPEGTQEYSNSFMTITSGGFADLHAFGYVVSTKLTVIIMISAWYLTNRNWWKNVVLVPLTMFWFQLSGTINFSIDYIDDYDFWKSLPIVLPIIIAHIVLSKKLGYLTKAQDVREKIEEELSSLRNE